MKTPKTGKNAIEMGEEALYLLRQAPAIFWICYYIGTMPFTLGLLYFVSDMSRGAYAEDRLAAGSLLLAALFLWMKVWQYVSYGKLRGFLSGTVEKPQNLGTLALSQLSLQPLGLFLLPVALVITAPFGWAYAYFQNLTVAGVFAREKIKNAHSNAYQQALRWPWQNHYLLLISSGIGLFVFINVVIMMMTVPQLLTRFLGIKEIFQPSGWSLLNTTFLAVAIGITHLILDPLIKTCYFLRIFYGESRLTGEDLRLDLQRAKSLRKSALTAFAALFLFFSSASPALGAPQNAVSSPQSPLMVQAQELDHEINEVLKQREYNWRLPREKRPPSDQKTWLNAFFESMAEMIANAVKSIFRLIRDFIEWVFSKFSFNPKTPEPRDYSFWLALPEVLTWLLIALISMGVVYFLYKYRAHFTRRKVVNAERVVVAPDLLDENLLADQLPEDEWLKLAREMMDSGNLRLAIRALFLGGIASLAEKQWITLARFKSNRDYERELRRRAASLPQLYSAFSDSVSIYDQVWYGLYDPTPELFQQFQKAVEQFKT